MSFFDKKYDRTWTNNDTDRQTFYGYDDDNGKTDWYDKNGNLDSTTKTPSSYEQEKNDDGY